MATVRQKQINKRNEIIEKVLPLIGDVSFEELSMKDICAVANISIGSFYHYFNKKEDILSGLLTLIDDYMIAEAFPKMKKKRESDNLLIFAKYWLKYVNNNGLSRSKLISSLELSDQNYEGEIRVTFTEVSSRISKAQANGEFSKELSAEELTSLFFMSLRGITVDWTRREAGFDIVKTGSEYIQILLKGMAK